jgi:hypothetical protein
MDKNPMGTRISDAVFTKVGSSITEHLKCREKSTPRKS